MIEKMGSTKALLIFTLFFILMFICVTFVIDPLIDGNNGSSIVALQLSFFKSRGLSIINSWGIEGVNNFNRYIFTDYIYAISYVLFFISILSALMLSKKNFQYKWAIYSAILAGIFDFIEDTLEIFFVNNPVEFSSNLFFLHSVIASLKWILLISVFLAIVRLSFKD